MQGDGGPFQDDSWPLWAETCTWERDSFSGEIYCLFESGELNDPDYWGKSFYKAAQFELPDGASLGEVVVNPNRPDVKNLMRRIAVLEGVIKDMIANARDEDERRSDE